MRNFRGIFVALIFLVLTSILLLLGKTYSELIGMAYPFASKTFMEYAALISNKTPLVLWQVIVAIFLVAVVVSFGLMILFRWNVFRWLGWVAAPAAIVLFLWMGVWGLNNYAKPIQESMKLPMPEYTTAELKEAAVFYRRQADRLAPRVNRDENGDIVLPSLEEMNAIASKSFDNLVWDFSVFAGPRGPVKALNFPDLISLCGFGGITIGLTGEAAVNMNDYGSEVPYNMCHEMSHLLAIAREDEANFAAYLACEYSKDPLFQYVGYLQAFLACSNTLEAASPVTWNSIWSGTSKEVLHDLEVLNEQIRSTDGTVKEIAHATNDSFLKASGQEEGTKTYEQVTDLLVAWYQYRYVVDDTPQPTQFNPFDYDEVFPTEPPVEETTEDSEEA